MRENHCDNSCVREYACELEKHMTLLHICIFET